MVLISFPSMIIIVTNHEFKILRVADVIITSTLTHQFVWFRLFCTRMLQRFEPYYALNFDGKSIASGESFGLGETKEFDMPGL